MIWIIYFLLIVILCGICFDEVFVYMQVFVDVGFDVIEILLNLFDWVQSVQFVVCVFGDCVLIGVGIVLCFEDVDLMVVVGGKLVVMFNMYMLVICVVVYVGFVICIGCMIVIEVFVVLDVGVQVLKIFLVGNFGIGYVCVFKVVLFVDVLVFVVGGIMFENFVDYFVVGCIGVGFGSDLYCLGQFVECIVECVCVFVVVYCVV